MMDFEWIAIALGDVVWICAAFTLGLLSRSIGLPPLVGFLATGFLLGAQGIVSGEMLQKLSDLGITLLLFTVGLKLSLRTLSRPEVWGVALLHSSIVALGFGVAIYGLAGLGLPFVSELDLSRSLLVAFALSFSSTVFVVKVLEQKGEMASLHGRVAVGILIMQDLAAVVFLAVAGGKWPSIWALLVLLVVPLRPFIGRVLSYVGHGELMVLYGFLLALGGAEVFEMVGLKGDLGALVLGVLIADHAKAEEMAKTMLGFKDLFLLGFFLSIGLSGSLSTEIVLAAAVIAAFVVLKTVLFMFLLTRFRLRARTSLLASLNLTNYSEFGLIVAAIGVANGWIAAEWLVIIAVALSISFAAAAWLNLNANAIYNRNREAWRQLQRPERLADDRLIDIHGARIAVIGMGGVGTGAYDVMRKHFGETVIGVDIDPVTAANQQSTGRRVLLGDPSDADFWDRVQAGHALDLVMLAVPKMATSLAVVEQLRETSFNGRIAATARFADEMKILELAGVDTVFNTYAEAGAGFASHVLASPTGTMS